MKKIIIITIILTTIILLLGVRKIIKENISVREVKMLSNITKVSNVTLVTIYDNYQSNPDLQTGWGFGCVVRLKDKTILFDTGADSETLLSNMEKLKIKPEEIDIVVLSHIHWDHVGGLAGFLEKNSNVTVYAPVSFPKSFKEEINQTGASVVEVGKEIEIEKGIFSTGELGTWIKEQSLVINSEKGLVIITGCSHPGIVKIVKRAKEITGKEVYLVIGGFHLSGARDSELKRIINDFRGLEVKKVAPCHCSGDRTRQLFSEEYKTNYIENGVGKIIQI